MVTRQTEANNLPTTNIRLRGFFSAADGRSDQPIVCLEGTGSLTVARSTTRDR